jgi:hypothetical protein
VKWAAQRIFYYRLHENPQYFHLTTGSNTSICS